MRQGSRWFYVRKWIARLSALFFALQGKNGACRFQNNMTYLEVYDY